MKLIALAFGASVLVACSASTPHDDPDADTCIPSTEICDNRDNDCDEIIDESDDGAPLQRSCDTVCGTGFEECVAGIWRACSAPQPTEEVCDELDNDCDGEIDEEIGSVYYRDADGDGFGAPGDTHNLCEPPPGFVENGDDCDDTNPDIHPGAEELMDAIDNDCDGSVDEGPCTCPLGETRTCGSDVGECELGVQVCGDHGEECATWGPCEGGIPPADEVCRDGLDNDCDGEVDDGCPDDWEPVRCWTVAPADDRLALIEVDMETGAWREVGRYGSEFESSFHTPCMAYFGETLVTSGSAGDGDELIELDLSTGETRRGGAYRPPQCVGVRGDELVLFCPDLRGLCFYDDFDAMVAGSSSRRVGGHLHASRFGVHRDEVYLAWHSTEVVDVINADTGAPLRTIELEGYDTWVWGVSVAGGRLHLIDDGRGDYEVRGQRIVSFDPHTGARLGEVVLTGLFPGVYRHSASGLWCESPGPELP